jgi:magnesium-transporting ATPase (P-type)
MKKTLSVVFIIILLIIGIFSLVNIFQSLWYIISFESFTAMNVGLLAGKVIFTALVFTGVYIFVKLYRALQS